jgi:hypothetical protein
VTESLCISFKKLYYTFLFSGTRPPVELSLLLVKEAATDGAREAALLRAELDGGVADPRRAVLRVRGCWHAQPRLPLLVLLLLLLLLRAAAAMQRTTRESGP